MIQNGTQAVDFRKIRGGLCIASGPWLIIIPGCNSSRSNGDILLWHCLHHNYVCDIIVNQDADCFAQLATPTFLTKCDQNKKGLEWNYLPSMCVCNPASGLCSMTKLLGDIIPTQISDYYSLRQHHLLLCTHLYTQISFPPLILQPPLTPLSLSPTQS